MPLHPLERSCNLPSLPSPPSRYQYLWGSRVTVPIQSPRDCHSIVTVTVTEETPYLSGLLATMTVMTLMTMIYGLILDEGWRRYFVGPYPFNLTRRTRRAEQGVLCLCDL